MKKLVLTLVMFSIILVLVACGNSEVEKTDGKQTEQVQADSLKSLENEGVGKYLADSKGMTLYYFTKDESGKSNCSGECLGNWPAFTEESFTVPEGYNQKDFGVITREENGIKQRTYKGYPLYYFVKDQKEGDINGQGVKDVWFVVNNETEF
ncbi:hypothetical protein BGM26_03530 [Bacillus sp. FJAT-29790]|uniref:COG4315 family predicted lipoprotein n=1 Tax=Bacillus sp. FJAT-29790 TaxID=1895002 RepID=UPI001C23F094|nr:hypothetical protein [Bacillus sp. FJAT-29790]MBU8878062.1 hypothetical protein [Bacillus sp. FJAT-29790]